MAEGCAGIKSDEKFRKNEHILKTGDFRSVYKDGRRIAAGFVVLGFRPNALGRNRLGFSIGSRKVPLASTRNRLKRLFREAYRRNKASLKKSFDMVIIIRSDPPRSLHYDDVVKLLLKTARGAGIFDEGR